MGRLTKLQAIIEGWVNYTLPQLMSNEEKSLAEQRAQICSTCPINTANRCSRAKGGCGCPLAQKTVSFHPDNNCPKNKWP
jgi:hypothetical protein